MRTENAPHQDVQGLPHLAAETFLVLRPEFFDRAGVPKEFALRDKRNTQDDPLDEHIFNVLARSLPSSSCIRAPGPLITPDMAVTRSELSVEAPRNLLRDAPRRLIGLEVKKLERTKSGGVARAAGLDYNTTPPCGSVLVYDAAGNPVVISGFYLFVCMEPADGSGGVVLTAMVLCDGNLLNADFDLYMSIVGEREKEIGLGTYGNGVDRKRPMLIFANPLGASELDHSATLVLSDDADPGTDELLPVCSIQRALKDSEKSLTFVAFRSAIDVPEDQQFRTLVDPFPMPANRQTTTQRRGRFLLPFKTSPAE